MTWKPDQSADTEYLLRPGKFWLMVIVNINLRVPYSLFSDEDVFNCDHGDDSGLSSSPSSPQSGDYDSASQLFDFEESLQSNFFGSLNTCLFGDELTSKLYTHIKIKEETDDEIWTSNETTLQQLKEDMFDGISFTDGCDFGEQFELMDKMLNPSLNRKPMDERIAQSRHDENDSGGALAEAVANRTTCTKSSTSENTTSAEESSPEDPERDTCKRHLRKRVKHVYADHDYCISSDDADKVESDDDGTDEKVEGIEEYDEEFKPSCCSAKKSRPSKNSKNAKSGKDLKYWERRKRNNLAAKRSREAKREREIETAKKTAALEKENATLKAQVKKLKAAIQRAEKRLRVMV